ncbi:helix-turn-helix domain-containing protein [Mesorhizobium sp. 43Arga]
MPENPRGIGPLSWRTLVDEALARRKEERLTQREHAALAGVSIPTIAAFERGEHTLTLAKAFDILHVVGLLDEPTEGGAQDRFVRASFDRWRALTNNLPTDSPARFPNGSYRFDYCLEGDLKSFALTEFEQVLDNAVTRHTGWPVFMMLTREDLAPREVGGAIEVWLPPESDGVKRNIFNDPAHCDFWRAVPSGRLFLIRGYQEDGQETFPPASVFDTTLPVWRMGEALLHAERLAGLMRKDPESQITVRFRALYTGLTSRLLRNWANPISDLMFEGRPARSDEVLVETEVPAVDISSRLADTLFPMVSAIYERFGVVGITANRIQAEVGRLLSSRMR